MSKPCDHLRGEESRGREEQVHRSSGYSMLGMFEEHQVDQCGSKAVSQGGNDGGEVRRQQRPDYRAFWTA